MQNIIPNCVKQELDIRRKQFGKVINKSSNPLIRTLLFFRPSTPCLGDKTPLGAVACDQECPYANNDCQCTASKQLLDIINNLKER